jgi:hypothetical protein
MADVPATTAKQPGTPISTLGEPIGRVNVYDNSARTSPSPSLDGQTTYATESAPVTSSSPALKTWLLILVVVLVALYFVVQFLT